MIQPKLQEPTVGTIFHESNYESSKIIRDFQHYLVISL